MIFVHRFTDADATDNDYPCKIDEDEGNTHKTGPRALSHSVHQFANHYAPPKISTLYSLKISFCRFKPEKSQVSIKEKHTCIAGQLKNLEKTRFVK